MYNFGRTLRAMNRPQPVLEPIKGRAFVFGSAPEPVVPEGILDCSTIVTANASQLYLEQFGIEMPHITCMRANMDDGKETSAVKLKALKGRKTGLLVLFAPRGDPDCSVQRKLLDAAGYRYDALQIIDRLDASTIYNKVLNSVFPLVHRNFRPSMGLRAVLHCIACGADQVALGGVSLRASGWSMSKLDYARTHIAGDQVVFDRICKRGLPVFPTDEALAADTGLRRWSSALAKANSTARHYSA